MADRTTKILLGLIAVLLLTSQLRTSLGPTPAVAQTNTLSSPPAPQMAISGGTIYLLQSGRLTIYQAETKGTKELTDGFGLGGPVTLRRLATQNVSQP